MKKFMLFIMCVMSLSLYGKYDPNFELIKKSVKVEMLSPNYAIDKLVYENDSVQFRFSPNIHYKETSNSYCSFINVSVLNKTEKRIYIEWENARICGSRAVAGKDRRITMDLEKADEAVSAGEFSELRSITPQNNVNEWPISAFSSVSNIYTHKKNAEREVPIILPIRFEEQTVDYKFIIKFSHYNNAELDSLYDMQKKNHALAKKIKKGMTESEVIEIMGTPKNRNLNQIEYPFILIQMLGGNVKKVKELYHL